MTTEQDRVLRALEIAIEMETDGKECYLEASKESRNEAGKKLLQSLAEEEDSHQLKFEEIYNDIRKGRAWPAIDLRSDKARDIQNTLVKTCEALGVNISSNPTELDAVKIAIDKEKKSYDFYECQVTNATYDAEKGFYQNLVAEERVHELALIDYYDYLSDPAGWFVKKEHPSPDGG